MLLHQTVAAAALSICVFTGICVMPVSAAAPDVTLTASGTFASPCLTGADELKLAGEPFTISVVINAAAVPSKHGPNWALYSPLKMTGQVHSGLLGSTPVNIASGAASVQQAVGPAYDLIMLGFPVKVVGINLTIVANITMPPGTLPNQLIHTFAPVQLSPATATVKYTDNAGTTTLAVRKGTLAATVPSAARSLTSARLALKGVWDDPSEVHVRIG
jgi:hypothetical protein